MHYKTWKHSSKIHFPHVLQITSSTKALAQLISRAQVSVRHIFFPSHTKKLTEMLCACVRLDSLKTLLNDMRGVQHNLKLL